MPSVQTWIRKIAGLPFGRIRTICWWCAAVLGLLLLMEGMISAVHIALLGLTFVTLVLCHTAWQRKPARVIARVLAVLPVVAVTVLFGVDGVLSSMDGVSLLTIFQPMCIIGLPVLCWALPSLTTLMKWGGRYDAWALRVVGLWLLILIALAIFTSIGPTLVWRWELPVLQYVWLAFAVVGWLLTWVPQK